MFISQSVRTTMPDEFRTGPNKYGIPVQSICYPPKTLLEGAPYDPRPWSGVARHLESQLSFLHEMEMQTLTQGDFRED
jgi:hypothetical protein